MFIVFCVLLFSVHGSWITKKIDLVRTSHHTKMSNKMKSQDKANRIAEIDEHIRRNFEIIKVNGNFKSIFKVYSVQSKSRIRTWSNFIAAKNQKIFVCMTLIALDCHPVGIAHFLDFCEKYHFPCHVKPTKPSNAYVMLCHARNEF